MAQKKKETTAKEQFKKAAPKKKIQSGKKSKVSKDFCSTTKRKAPKAKSKKPKAPKVPESFYDDLAHMQSIFGPFAVVAALQVRVVAASPRVVAGSD